MAGRQRRPLKRRISRFLKRRARPALNRFLVRYSRVGDPVVFDNALFPWTKTLEAHYDEIRREALRLGELHDRLPSRQSDERLRRTAQERGLLPADRAGVS